MKASNSTRNMKTINTNLLILGIALVTGQAAPAEVQPPVSALEHPSATNSPAFGSAYMAPLAGKTYLGFDAGVALQQAITLSDTVGDSEKISFDPGGRLDLQVGCAFATNWSVELELGLIANQVKSSYAFGTDYTTVNLMELPLLVNVIYSHPLGGHCSAYVGGGAGGVFIHYENLYYTTPTASTLGYQGMAGIRYAFSPRWEIGVGYKILGTTGYNVDSGVAFNGYTPTEYKSNGNLTQAILLTFTCRF